jgi:hypothetical protein
MPYPDSLTPGRKIEKQKLNRKDLKDREEIFIYYSLWSLGSSRFAFWIKPIGLSAPKQA